MKVHLVGVAETGMGQLAALLKDAGHAVSGSDTSFDPGKISRDLDLVVIGDAILRDNVEAVRAEELKLERKSMSAALRSLFVAGKRPLVVTGAHGKTITASMCAWILDRCGLEPGFFLSGGARLAGTKRKITAGGAKPAPFVIASDDYDVCVDAESTVIVTSIEDEAPFEAVVNRIGPDGLIVADARDPVARRLVSPAKARVAFYALDGDATGAVTPTWLGVMVPPADGVQPFDVFLGGSSGGRFALSVPGAQSVRNALGALAACAEGFGVDIEKARSALTSFKGGEEVA